MNLFPINPKAAAALWPPLVLVTYELLKPDGSGLLPLA